ncbi:MAG: signal peptidase II [Ruminococcaceae bacterium]|nr:signal peptidase II [Oscillospiraceae bacterium]
MSLVLFLILALGIPVLDQITKLIVDANMTLGESIPLIKDVFHITYIHNEGAAMGMLSEHRWVFLILSTVAIIAIFGYIVYSRKTIAKMEAIAFGMIAGGGIGNMIDRTFYGESLFNGAVIDFFDFRLFSFWKWIFNVADIAVCVGVGLYALYVILTEVQAYKKRKAENAAASVKEVTEESND